MLVFVAGFLFVLADAWKGLGTPATGPRRAHMEKSEEWRGGRFVNAQEIINDWSRTFGSLFRVSPNLTPSRPVPLGTPDLSPPPSDGLRVTWLGHSSVLVEIDGARVLTDPLLSERASPVDWTGPKRWYPSPIPLEKLPPIDAVVISHDHYDHLDQRTIARIKDWDTKFVVPLGVGADLAYWGVPASKIVELDWWDVAPIGNLAIHLTPARHASGRGVTDRDAKLWGGYMLVGTNHRVYYSGDSGLFPGLRDVGIRFGPIDLTMIEIGQYDAAWPDWHMGPEQAIMAHQMVQGRLFLPVHWGAIALASHGWTEPIERALAAATNAGISIVTPKPGESFDPIHPPPPQQWWPSLPWKTAEEDPIVSSQMNETSASH